MSRTSTRDVSRMSVAELKAVIIEHDGLSAELESIVEKRELRARAAAALDVAGRLLLPRGMVHPHRLP